MLESEFIDGSVDCELDLGWFWKVGHCFSTAVNFSQYFTGNPFSLPLWSQRRIGVLTTTAAPHNRSLIAFFPPRAAKSAIDFINEGSN